MILGTAFFLSGVLASAATVFVRRRLAPVRPVVREIANSLCSNPDWQESYNTKIFFRGQDHKAIAYEFGKCVVSQASKRPDLIQVPGVRLNYRERRCLEQALDQRVRLLLSTKEMLRLSAHS